jgi:DNA gyrase subunit A
VRHELHGLAERYSDPRRTTIYDSEKSVKLADLLASEEVVVTMSREGYVRQIPMAVYQRGMSAGKRISLERYEGDYVERAFVAHTDDTLLFFSSDGRAYGMGVRDVPETGISSRGKALGQIFDLGKKARVVAVHRVTEFRADRFALFLTADGTVKRTPLDQYANARSGIEAIKLTEKDRVLDVRVTDGEAHVVLAGRGGRAIRFPEAEIPTQGRVSQGVRGIKLKDGEAAAGLAVARHGGGELCVVTERGWAKRIALEEMGPQGRGGLGTAILATSRETGEVAGVRELHPGEDLMAVTAVGRTLRVKGEKTPLAGRAGAAEKVVPVSGHDRVVDLTPVAEREPGPDDGDGDGEGGIPVLSADPADDAPPPAPAAESAPLDEPSPYEAADPGPGEPSSDGAAAPDPDEPPTPPAAELDLFA